MTISVIYYKKDKNNEEIRCCADSRISSGNDLLTNHAMKILPLKISYTPYYETQYKKKALCYEVGFTYAGHVAVAMFVYCLLSHFCKNIDIIPNVPNSDKTLPSLYSISNLAGQILIDYIKDYGSIYHQKAYTEILIFGYCSQLNEYKAYHIQTNLSEAGDLYYKVIDTDIKNVPYYAIGSGKILLEDKIEKNDGEFNSKLVREIINDENSTYKGVGGFYQRGYCKTWLQLYNEAPSININMPFLGKYPMAIFLGTHFVSLTGSGSEE